MQLTYTLLGLSKWSSLLNLTPLTNGFALQAIVLLYKNNSLYFSFAAVEAEACVEMTE